MRKLVAVSLLGLWVVMGVVSPALANDDNEMPTGLEKFHRGLVNVAVGVPDEVIAHSVGGLTEYGEDSLGGSIVGLASGTFMGLFWGFARVGSGIVDIFTFPFPFNENRPLVEPDHHV
jgi:putative exosortase-associated protein (TIGR04073 family)